MRYLITLTMSACCLFAAAAHAQDSEKGQKALQALNDKFNAADTNHDGKLSSDEAKAGMPHIAEHFSEIDTDKDGYVSKAEIMSAMAAMKAKRDADHAK
jgi:Ca2+-binding EF-hand superfamily protein